jgi:hypothetical protein
MRIALLIGISDFVNCNNLPGCLNDIKAMNELLQESKEFDEIKVFEKTVNSDELKSNLTSLFNSWKDKTVDELFFYFTGHGSFYKEEFYYLLSDFDENKRRQTSLQNSEIDNMIKGISPALVTKVIDACQSGVSYIKGSSDIIEKYYAKTSESFKKCYFMHSSMTDQYSYQDNDLSDFTRSFLGAIKSNSKPTIRYKDIIDYISDEFEKSTEQTPFFITQAGHTESFLIASEALTKVLSNYFKNEVTDTKKTDDTPTYNSYIDKIKKEAELYSSQVELEQLLMRIKTNLEGILLKEDIAELYDKKVSFENFLRDLPRCIEIGRWINENRNSYFAEPDYETVSYTEEVAPNPFGSLISRMQGNKVITKQKEVLKGYDLTIDVPYKSILIDFIPRYPNLSQYAIIISFLSSKKNIKFYHAFTIYTEQSWTRKSISSNFKWQSSDFLIKDSSSIDSFINKIVEDNILNMSNEIKKLYEDDKK